MPNFIDLTGRKFDRLTVIERAPNGNKKQVRFKCLCDCGNETEVQSQSLRTGVSKSCGCFAKERAAEEVVKRNKRHGLSKTRTHNIWQGIKNRCLNKNIPAYLRYGGRGITVCDEWLTFDKFLSDMGECPNSLTIERLNNDMGYSKENCVWASMEEQQNNRSNNRFIAFNGERKTVAQWEKSTGIGRRTISERLRRGWTVEKTLTKPV